MRLLFLNGSDVARLLPMGACIEAMAQALAALAQGEALVPLRQVLRLPDGQSAFAAMPASLGRHAAFGLKAISVFPGNHARGLDSHHGAVLLFEPEQGRLLAVLDAAALTAIRTAAVSALATRLLARPAATELALIGTGVQARTHLQALLLVRGIERVRVYSRDPAHVSAFVEQAARRHGVRVEAARSARQAVDGADIVCTLTSSGAPVVEGDWLAAGAHVNAVGASLPDRRELDSAAVRDARLFVDRRESALHEAGDVLIPIAEGAFGPEHIQGELGELLLGRAIGRSDPRERTVFKSLGLAVEDLAAAQLAHANAGAAGLGTWLDLAGSSDAGV